MTYGGKNGGMDGWVGRRAGRLADQLADNLLVQCMARWMDRLFGVMRSERWRLRLKVNGEYLYLSGNYRKRYEYIFPESAQAHMTN